jgi:hypothetical protein
MVRVKVLGMKFTVAYRRQQSNSSEIQLVLVNPRVIGDIFYFRANVQKMNIADP